MNLDKKLDNLIKKNKAALELNSRIYGGVFIVEDSGTFAIVGADNLDYKIIFLAEPISTTDSNLDFLLLCLVNRLKAHGIEVITKKEFSKSMKMKSGF